MRYTEKFDTSGKKIWVFCKDGVYFAMNRDQVSEMLGFCEKILEEVLDEEAKSEGNSVSPAQG